MGDLRKRRKHSCWTEQEEKKLQKIWGTVRDSEVAAALGKTTSAVREKAKSLGLRVKARHNPPGEVSYSWERAEELILIKNVGHLNIFELMELLPGRSRVAIERRCYELGFPPAQGTYSRLQIEKNTGYDWRQIRRARDALGQNWKRYGLRKYMITDDQVQDIVAYLATEKRRWSVQYGLDNCRKCGVDGDRALERHSGDGLCKRCWDMRRHFRKVAVVALNEGRALLLTEEAWESYIKPAPAV